MNPDDAPSPVPGPQDRPWSHPSEIGLATRGHTDRRRSSIIATGVVLGGIGLLLSGVLLGATRDHPVSMASEPIDRIERSLRTVVVVERGRRSFLGGIVIDDRGNLVAPADLSDADEVFVRQGDGSLHPVQSVLCHESAAVSVLVTGVDQGSAVTTVGTTPAVGADVLLAEVTEDRMLSVDATIGDEPAAVWSMHRQPQRFLRTTGSAAPETTASFDAEGKVVFDLAGRLVGFTDPHPTASSRDHDAARALLHPVGDVLGWARELLDELG